MKSTKQRRSALRRNAAVRLNLAVVYPGEVYHEVMRHIKRGTSLALWFKEMLRK